MKKLVFFSLCVLLAIFIINSPALANGNTNNSATDKVIIYMIDNLSLNDISPSNTPYIWSLQNKAGIGLLNTVTGSDRTIKNACSTISAGKLAVGSSNAHLNFQANSFIRNEKVANVFVRNTGYLPDPKNIVVTNIEIIRKNNEKRRLGIPGQLGDTLHALGLSTAVVGNSDRFKIYDRTGALVLMNSRGIVDYGLLDSTFTTDRHYWTNYDNLIEQVSMVQNNDVLLIEYGDLTRLEAMHSLFSSTQYNNKRQKILSKIDQSIQDINQKLASDKTCSYIISPSPSRNSYVPEALLTPIIIIKPEISGVITSFSTRTEGIVLLTSLKNSIINCFNSSVKDPIYSSPNNNSFSYLKNLNKKATFNYINQTWILTVLIGFIVFLLLCIPLLYKYKLKFLINYILILTLSLPLTLLFISLFSISNRYIFIALAILLCLAITFVTLVINKVFKKDAIEIILILTIATILVDLVLKLGLISGSIMSYQIISGARYYGLGNEYMGVLIGSTISLGVLYLSNSYSLARLNIIKILFALVIFFIGFPLFGANVGGTITACIALGYTIITLYKSKFKLNDLLMIVIGCIVIVSLMALFDVHQPFQLQSHLGKNINIVSNEGLSSLFAIIVRKLQMHLRLINYNYLGWIFLILLISFLVMLFKPNSIVTKIKNHFGSIHKGLKSILIAAIIAIIFNDSGITAAATLSIYFITLLVYSLVKVR